MKKTKPIYFEPTLELQCNATVQSIEQAENFKQPDCHVVILDQTVCHPQGGGQPFDTGIISGDDSSSFEILDARMDRDTECIHHIGKFTNGLFSVGDVVKIKINQEKRLLYSQLHTAGHLVDASLHLLGYEWKPTKGYHFPGGPYVEWNTRV